jgi:hypothetical protein
MNDRPTADELVDAVRRFLEAELLPALTDPRLRFQTLVAANVLAVVGRELPVEEEALRQERRTLAEVLGEAGAEPASLEALRRAVWESNDRLCGRIRAGEFDEPARWRALAERLRPVVVGKLEVANPRYLAAREAEGGHPFSGGSENRAGEQGGSAQAPLNPGGVS